ncbi:MAG: hypothetical protein MJ252_12980 [archaeon]|nr:hypothetical protein [archaeon]
MKSIKLNFFGEEAEVNIPTSLESLKTVISEKFFFSPSEVADLALYYTKDFAKKVVETEEEYRQFVTGKFNELFLDVKEESRLFKQTESELILKEKMKSLDEDLKKKEAEFNLKHKAIVAEKKALKKQIQDLKAKLEDKKSEEAQLKEGFEKEKEKTNEELRTVKKALGIEEPEKPFDIQKIPIVPISMKVAKKVVKKVTKKFNKLSKYIKKTAEETKKKFSPEEPLPPVHDYERNVEKVQREMGTQIKAVHKGFICDGCGCHPIQGVRYKCAICEDFDYCEDCEEMNVNAHPHPFIKIAKPEYAPVDIKCAFNH